TACPNGLDVFRYLRVVAKRLPKLHDDARERSWRDERLFPDAVEDLVFLNDAFPALDQEDEDFERFGFERKNAARLRRLEGADIHLDIVKSVDHNNTQPACCPCRSAGQPRRDTTSRADYVGR